MHIRAIAFNNAGDLKEFMQGVYDQKLPLWSVTFINPDAARFRNHLPPHLHHGHAVKIEHPMVLPEKFTALLSCTADRCDQVEQGFLKLACAHNGELLSDEIAQHEWAARFEPMRAKRIAPSLIPSEVVVPVEQLDSVLEDIAQEINHPFILEGLATDRREFVLLGFIPHDERRFDFALAFGLSLSVLRTAEKHGGRPYATGLYFTGFADKVLGQARVHTLTRFKQEADPRHIMNPGKVLDSNLIATGVGIAHSLEPLIKVFGNWAKSREPGEVFREKAGIPGDVAWYAYACSQCGYCIDHCDQYYGRGWESQSPRGKWTFLKMVLEGEAQFDQQAVDTFLACTTCEMCNQTCQLDLPVEPSWLKLRGLLVDERGFRTFPPFEIMANALRQQGNIWAGYADDRDAWVTGEIRENIVDQSEYAFFAGCTASYVEHDLARSAALLLKEAGIKFAYLGNMERCCAIPMLVSGRWEVFEETAALNIENMKKTGARTVITTCPACRLIWDVYYRKWAEEHGVDYPFRALHYSEVLAERIKDGTFKLTNSVNRKVAYHDPCHMGRASGVFESPRTLIKAIPGADYRELRFNKENAHCCGSVLTLVADIDVAADVGAVRVQEAIDAGADTLITACPCCRVQLQVSAEKKGLPVEIKDLATLAAEGMGLKIEDSNPIIDEKWAVFDAMIRMMTPWGMADMMAGMLPDMIEVMPGPFKGMMHTVKGLPMAARAPMISMMKSLMPSLFPVLLPGMMPKLMPRMLAAVSQAIPMPDYMQEQMPDLMPRTMEVLMPKMLPEIIPYFMPKMVEYLSAQ
jgi:Fe-S oxidoreductase